MYSFVSRGSTALALIALSTTIAHADAMSDQQKAFRMHGFKVPHPPAMCSLLTRAEAARYLGKPVAAGESAGSVSGCAYRALDGSNDGVLVVRQSPDAWYPPTSDSRYHVVGGLGTKAYTAYETGLGYEAGVLNVKGVTSVQLSGRGTAATALALVRIAMKR